jgi:integrase/recombinase XerD
MPNTTVSITRRIDRKYYPIVLNSNGSIKPNVVMIDGVETPMKGGNFYISWYEGRKATRVSVGSDPTLALNKKWAKQHALNSGEPTAVAPPKPVGGRETLAAAVKRYLASISADIKRNTKDPKTLAAYSTSCNYFVESTSKKFITDITTEDLLGFMSFLQEQKRLSERSISNRFTHVMIFLKWAKHLVEVPKGQRPDPPDELVEVYEDEELDALFAACTPKERLMFQTFLKTGMRGGEAAHLMWKDVLSKKNEIKVKLKEAVGIEGVGWKPKKRRERFIPIPAALMAELESARGEATSLWVFPNLKGEVNQSMLETLKYAAKRAGLDPANFYLHKFRATYATTCLRKGVDLVTLQKWMGHSPKDLKSMMRYLDAAGGAVAQAKVEAVWA